MYKHMYNPLFLFVLMGAILVQCQVPAPVPSPNPVTGCHEPPVRPVILETDPHPGEVHVHFHIGEIFDSTVTECYADATEMDNVTLISRTPEYSARTRIDVYDLFNGQSYCFSVRCKNACGTSPVSNRVCEMPWSVPLPPALKSLSTADGEVTITYGIPRDTNREQVLYYVFTAEEVDSDISNLVSQKHWPANITKEQEKGEGTHEFDVSDEMMDSMLGHKYEFTVQAYNIRGHSLKSNAMEIVIAGEKEKSYTSEVVIGLSVALALVLACLSLYCYCRCKRTRRRDFIDDDHIELGQTS